MNSINAAHLFLLTLGLGLCIYYYPALPEQIPTRYNLGGEPTDYSRSGALFVIWGVWLATAILLEVVHRNPQWNTSTVPGLTLEQRRIYRGETARLLPLINLMTGVLMLVVLVEVLYTALHESESSPRWSLLVGALYILAAVYLTVWSTRRAKHFAKAS